MGLHERIFDSQLRRQTPDPTAIFPLDSSHPQGSSILSGAVALKQGKISGSEPQTQVFGYTPEVATPVAATIYLSSTDFSSC
jgi:hypothetical protein